MKPHMWQWGKVQRSRPGIKNHPYFEDEPDVVIYTDYKYWIRFNPNFGWNLPVIGYFKKGVGFRRRVKV